MGKKKLENFLQEYEQTHKQAYTHKSNHSKKNKHIF